MTTDPIAEMDRGLVALVLEVPGAVYEDLVPKWTSVRAEVVRLREQNERQRKALHRLAEWDMLHLDDKGHGTVTHDAPWVRALIAAALDENLDGFYDGLDMIDLDDLDDGVPGVNP